MKTLLKKAAVRFLASPPAWTFLRNRAQTGQAVAILCYHTLGAGGADAWTVLRLEDFRRQIAILRRHYDIVSLDKALEGLDPQAESSGRPRAVLTFDDGEAGLHRHLLPLVEQERLPVTVYVATDQIATGRPYWFDRVMGALQTDRPQMLDLSAQGLGRWTLPGDDGPGRWRVMGPLLERLKEQEPAVREEIADRIVQSLPEPPQDRRLMPMSRAQLAELAASPHVTIGAHSHCHSLLDQIPLDQARDSMARSRALLQEWTGQEVAHFAYPNGNYDEELCRTAAELGFRSATILETRLARVDDDRFALPRLPIGRYDSAARFRLRLAEL